MLVHHHHLDPRRALRIFIAIWILLLVLLLLPVRTHAQAPGQPPSNSVELIDDSPAFPAPELLEVMAIEIVLLVAVMISYLVFSARHEHVAHPRHLPNPLH
ncbi:MAG: hypothetical protein ACXVZV_09255 [Terriglobales bacterium]